MKNTSLSIKQRQFIQIIRQSLFEQKSSFRLFSLMEAGQTAYGATSDLVAALQSYPVKYWQFLPNEQEYSIAELAPYLIDLQWLEISDEDEALTTFSEWLIKQNNFTQWGLFFISNNPFDELISFLRRFVYIEFSQQRSYFRFYNPRIFQTFYKNLAIQDKLDLHKSVGTIVFFDYYKPEIIHISYFRDNELYEENFSLSNWDGLKLPTVITTNFNNFISGV